MIKIYQIGRLDIQKRRFKIEGKEYSSFLTSFALKEHFDKKMKNAKVCLFYPVSLAVQSGLNDSQSDISNLISSINYNSFLRFFQSHPNKEYADDLFMLPSFGNYNFRQTEINFKSNVSVIILLILLKFVEDYLDYYDNNQNTNDCYEIYVDISSGLNVYISSLMEAVRNFYVFYKLFSLNDNKLKVYLLYSDPIINNSTNVYNIYKDYELNFKVFFNISPGKKGDNLYQIYDSIEVGQKKNELQKILTSFLITFNSLRLFSPLPIYYSEIYEPQRIKSEIVDIICYYKEKFKNNILDTSSINKSEKVIKSILSFAFYYGIISNLKIKQMKWDSIEISLKEIKEKFRGIYQRIGLSTVLLEREINKIEEYCNTDNDFDYKCLCDFQNYPKVKKNNNIERRNFEAHAGFVNTLTLVKKEKGEIFLKYDEKNNNGNVLKNLLEGIINW